MSYKITKLNNIKIISTVLFTFAIVLSLLIIFNSKVSESIHNSVSEELSKKVKQQQVMINDEMTHKEEDLISLASYIVNGEFTDESLQKLLSQQVEKLDFIELYMVDKNGDGIAASRSDMKVNLRGNKVLNEALETGEFAVGMNRKSTIFKGLIDCALPVYVDGEIQAVLMAEYDTVDLSEQLANTIGQGGYAFIISIEGEEIFSSTPYYIPLERLYEDDVEFLDDKSAEIIQQDLTNRQGSRVYFELENVKRVAVYEPLEYGGWSVVLVEDEEQVEEGMRNIADLITYVSLILFIMLVIFVLYTWYSKIKSVEKMSKIAYYDELTGLPNLTKLKLDMEEILKKNPKKKYAILKIDVDNFKAINELYDFEVGNEVLKGFKHTTSAANEPSLIAARTGIDEFMIFAGNGFLDEIENRTHLYESEHKKFVPELEHHRLSFKYGRYFIQPGETNVDDIVNKVSMAHTMAKSLKGKIIYDYDAEYKQKLLEQADITNKMEDALNNNEFVAYLQPKFRARDSKIVGAEALVRWIDSSGKITFPNAFIPLFEKNGFITQLDKYILKTICEQIKKWLEQGHECMPISVNFSRVHLGNPKFVEEISEIVEQVGIPYHYIEIELTESTILENEALLEALLTDLHQVGFGVSIDDFGAGYSSLGLLKNFKVSTLKLDRSFFINNKFDERGDLVVEGIIKLAHSLEMKIVAEGIEEEGQVEFLKSVDCESIQGYFFAKPMPIHEYEQSYVRTM